MLDNSGITASVRLGVNNGGVGQPGSNVTDDPAVLSAALEQGDSPQEDTHERLPGVELYSMCTGAGRCSASDLPEVSTSTLGFNWSGPTIRTK
jgi:hypothetical protein